VGVVGARQSTVMAAFSTAVIWLASAMAWMWRLTVPTATVTATSIT
jgi:hypothetical protein